MNKKKLETKIFLEWFDTKDMKLIFKTAILVLWLVLSENSRMHNGRIVKEHSNEIIREIINEADKKHSYYLGGVEMIANDVINFVKKDIIILAYQ